MQLTRYIKIFAFRHAFSVSLAVAIAFLGSHYYGFSHEYWMVLTAFLVSQTTRGTPVKQGVSIFITIMAAIIASSFLIMYVKNPHWLYATVSVVAVASSGLAFIKRPQSNKAFFTIILFSTVLLIATLSPVQSLEFMQNRMMDAALGGLIGIICTLYVFPVRLDVEFSEGIIPVLQSLHEYSQALTESLLDADSDLKNVVEKRINLENSLQAHRGIYPGWVYEVGFNRGLRSGFRFFLVNVERITEIYFSMDALISRKMDLSLLNSLYRDLENAMQKNQELITILTEYFHHNKITGSESDFTTDIKELEKALHRVVPDNIEALDVSPGYLLITAFVREMRDLRGLLLQLVMALPAAKH